MMDAVLMMQPRWRLDHVARCQSGAQENAGQVDGQHGVPVFELELQRRLA
jgi:hypothetical protein